MAAFSFALFVAIALVSNTGHTSAHHEENQHDHENHVNRSSIEPRFFYGKRIPLPGLIVRPTTAPACTATMATCCRRSCPSGSTCPTPPATTCTGGGTPASTPCLDTTSCPACSTFTTCTPPGNTMCAAGTTICPL